MMSLNSVSTCTSCLMFSARSAGSAGAAASAPNNAFAGAVASAEDEADVTGDCRGAGPAFCRRTRIFRALLGVGGGCCVLWDVFAASSVGDAPGHDREASCRAHWEK